MFTAKDIMTEEVIRVRPEMPVYDAIELLVENEITGMPVVDDGSNLVGVLSEKDVLAMLYAMEDNTEQTVGDYMSTGVVSLDVNASLIDLCDCLTRNVFRRVLITENGKLAGVVSRSDMIKIILKIKKHMANQI
jgi:predicted transcriptional regulator